MKEMACHLLALRWAWFWVALMRALKGGSEELLCGTLGPHPSAEGTQVTHVNRTRERGVPAS